MIECRRGAARARARARAHFVARSSARPPRWSRLAGLLVAAGVLACRPSAGPGPAPDEASAPDPYIPFLERRAAHQTQLRHDGPSPGKYEPGVVPEGATEVHYPSGSHELLAWLALPPEAPQPVPGLVYFHGAFSLVPEDFEAVRPFVDAGFAVLTPALRGENGNPGRLELLYGELDDAVAATRWLAEHPAVDGARLYAIGHSVGGGVAALVALHPEAPLRLTASVGGLYVPETFQRWSRSKANAALVRFDPFDASEGTLRTLGPNVRDLARPHLAYMGEQDEWFHPNAEAIAAEAARWGAPLEVIMVPGDHMSSLGPALERFLARAKADAAED
ncbi:MAG: prolyl oligopeptidase family serine peptidase [Myxococcales bacterium]|nr:prolyl oligopeptidase family serine peptidase [Myxococcales bacterium]